MTLDKLKALCTKHDNHTFDTSTMKFFGATPLGLYTGPGGTFYAEKQTFDLNRPWGTYDSTGRNEIHPKGEAFGVVKRVTFDEIGRPDFELLNGGPDSGVTPQHAKSKASAWALIGKVN